MKCPKCGSENVTVELEQVGSKTKKTGVGLGGHVNNAARGLTAIATLGMSNLIWKTATGEEETREKNQQECVWTNCGYSWNIK